MQSNRGTTAPGRPDDLSMRDKESSQSQGYALSNERIRSVTKDTSSDVYFST